MKVVALAGGTGSAKLLRGLVRQRCDLTVVANVGDNVWAHGLYVCPDIDIAMYTLAGIADRAHGWGIEGDTYAVLAQLRQLGQETWFALGDRDMAISIVRTRMMSEGSSLTEATVELCRLLNVGERVLPATDSTVETRIRSKRGEMHLQEYWVKNKGRPGVEGVRYSGAARARPTREVEKAIANADRIVICPANPVTSIGPILAIGRMGGVIARSRARKVALSPMVGKAPYSGPAGKLMRAQGIRTDSVGVAGLYSRFLDAMIIDERDVSMKQEVERLNIGCALSDASMQTPADERRLAAELLRL